MPLNRLSDIGGNLGDTVAAVPRHQSPAGRVVRSVQGQRQPDASAEVLAEAPHLDDKHSVFGKVVGGMGTLRSIEALGRIDGMPAGLMMVLAIVLHWLRRSMRA